jgi:hypothetical protein
MSNVIIALHRSLTKRLAGKGLRPCGGNGEKEFSGDKWQLSKMKEVFSDFWFYTVSTCKWQEASSLQAKEGKQ